MSTYGSTTEYQTRNYGSRLRRNSSRERVGRTSAALGRSCWPIVMTIVRTSSTSLLSQAGRGSSNSVNRGQIPASSWFSALVCQVSLQKNLADFRGVKHKATSAISRSGARREWQKHKDSLQLSHSGLFQAYNPSSVLADLRNKLWPITAR
jgi:hypothetical protein